WNSPQHGISSSVSSWTPQFSEKPTCYANLLCPPLVTLSLSDYESFIIKETV
ncbi:Uncharacterized protein DAT39_020374, partial [Clarias magur]